MARLGEAQRNFTGFSARRIGAVFHENALNGGETKERGKGRKIEGKISQSVDFRCGFGDATATLKALHHPPPYPSLDCLGCAASNDKFEGKPISSYPTDLIAKGQKFLGTKYKNCKKILRAKLRFI